MIDKSLQHESSRAAGSGQSQPPQASQRNIGDYQIPQQTVQGSPAFCGQELSCAGLHLGFSTPMTSASLDSVFCACSGCEVFAYHPEVKSTNIMVRVLSMLLSSEMQKRTQSVQSS